MNFMNITTVTGLQAKNFPFNKKIFLRSSKIKIFHRNGCGPTPRACGNTQRRHINQSETSILPPGGELTNQSVGSQLFNLDISMDGFWSFISNLDKAWRNSNTKLNKFYFLLNDVVILNCVIQARDYCLRVKNLETPID